MVRTDDRQAPPDPFPLPAFEHRLWDELAALHAEAAAAGSGRPRRQALTAVVGVAAVAAVVTAVALVGVVGDDGTPVAPAAEGDVSTGPPTELAPGDEAIAVETRSDGWTLWRDETTGEWRTVDGSTGAEFGLAAGDPTTVVRVDHDRREFWSGTLPGSAASPGTVADRVARDIERQGMVLEGIEVVGGREVERWGTPPGSLYHDHEVWIDPASDRPVREVENSPGLDGELGPPEWEVDFAFLPRLAENVAQSQVEVPDGYREVPAPGDVAVSLPES